MALTMIDPASSWFEIVELPLVNQPTTNMVNGKQKVSNELIFNKSSNQNQNLEHELKRSKDKIVNLECEITRLRDDISKYETDNSKLRLILQE